MGERNLDQEGGWGQGRRNAGLELWQASLILRLAASAGRLYDRLLHSTDLKSLSRSSGCHPDREDLCLRYMAISSIAAKEIRGHVCSKSHVIPCA